MQKLKMHSPNLTQENIARIRELFPGCVTEAHGSHGKLTLAVDFDQLRQELSESIVEGPQERYRLDWPGKREAMLAANAPIAKTLRPSREESVEFDSTKNLFIEGDNLDALKLLQETYLGKVKMIYIDPPYNTGNDFIYNDDFAETSEDFLQRSNQKDEAGNRLVANTESNGRFHSDWLTMMYSRLKLARNLLRDEGVIFISIDDGEQANLRKICDAVFGEENFVSNIMWQKRYSAANDHKTICPMHDFVLVYRKSDKWQRNLLPRTKQNDSQYRYEDEKGIFRPDNYKCNKTADERPNLYYAIIHPETGEEIWPSRDAVWRYSQERHRENVKNDLVFWGKNGNAKVPSFKRYRDSLLGGGGTVPASWWTFEFAGHNDEAAKETSTLIGNRVFSTPKPIRLLSRILQISTVSTTEDIILDFFSGSGVTAHAVMQLNAEDGGNRQFIMVQLPEACAEQSEAYKAGFATIAEIGKERIRRAGKKIKEELAQKTTQGNLLDSSERPTPLDVGFRVLKVDSSNMAEVYYTPDATTQAQLSLFTDNIKPGRKPEDLLFQVLLDWGVDLTLPIERRTIHGKTVFFVANNALVACFDSGVNAELVKALAGHTPLRVVFRDSGFVDDATRINVEQIFKQLSSATEVKVL